MIYDNLEWKPILEQVWSPAAEHMFCTVELSVWVVGSTDQCLKYWHDSTFQDCTVWLPIQSAIQCNTQLFICRNVGYFFTMKLEREYRHPAFSCKSDREGFLLTNFNSSSLTAVTYFGKLPLDSSLRLPRIFTFIVNAKFVSLNPNLCALSYK